MIRPSTCCRVVLLAGVVAACALRAGRAAEPAAFWPQFHGPKRDNCSTETGLPRKWPSDGPKLLWTAKGLGEGYAGVSIAQGKIYTAGNLAGRTMITAIDLAGKQLWQVPNGPAWEGFYPGTRGTPTIDGQRLYHESPLGNVACLDANTGRELWQVNILKTFGSENIRWALAESLLIDGDRVICSPGGPKASLAALDKLSGRTVWAAKSTGDLAGYASPILVEHQGLRMLITLNARAMIGVEAEGGELLWRVGFTTLFDENVLQPIFHDGAVFASGLKAGSVQWKVEVRGRQAAVTETWRSAEIDNHHGGMVLVDGRLYGGNSGGFGGARWFCLDWKSGKTLHSDKGLGKGSLTYADGMLYVLTERHVVGLVEATPSRHQVVSQFKLPAGGQGPSWAHPVICGGRLYVRHGEFLYAYDVGARP